MEKLLINPYDRECMKMAMLKHEETFKQQVYELHRLYRMQRILMKSINQSNCTDGDQIQARWDLANGMYHNPPPALDLGQRVEAEHLAETSDREVVLGIEDESEIQLTLGPTSYNQRKKYETPRTSESGASFSSSSTGSASSSHIMRRTTSETMLREGFTGHQWGITMVQSGRRRRRRRNSFDHVEEPLINQDRVVLKQQPSWLSQPLSLKFRT